MDVSTIAAFWAVSFLFVITPGADWAYAIAAGLRHRSVVPAVAGLLTGHLLATAVVAAGVAGVVARNPGVLTGLTVAGALYLVWMGVGTLRSAGGVSVGGVSVGGVSVGGGGAAGDGGAVGAYDGARDVVGVGGVGAGGEVGASGVAAGVGAGASDDGRAGDAGRAGGAGVREAVGLGQRASRPAGTGGSGGSARRQYARGVGISGLNPKLLLLFLALLPPFADPAAAWPVAAQIVALGSVHVASCAVVYVAVGIGARTVLSARPAAARAVTRFSGAAMVIIGVVLVVEKVAH